MAGLPLNPSSVHYHGQLAQKYVATARETIKELTGSNHVIFTAGGTEANNLGLHLLLHDLSEKYHQPCQLIYFLGEHPSIKNFAKQMDKGFPPAVAIGLKPDGLADIEALHQTLQTMGDGPKLIALQLVNHETGICQPLDKIVTMANQHHGFILADGIQFFPHRRLDMASMGLTAATLASHKLGGLHGAAGLLLMTPPAVNPLHRGGGQEQGYRPGTQNTLAIYSMAMALREAIEQQPVENKNYQAWRDRLESGVKKIRDDVILVGQGVPRLDHVALLVDKKIAGQEMVLALDSMGISVSSGAACSSGKLSPSETLAAMWGDKPAVDALHNTPAKNLCKNSLRISFGTGNRAEDVDVFLQAYKKIVSHY